LPRSILLTGYPGFIAGQLLGRMLAEPGTTVRLLVLPQMKSQGSAALDALAASQALPEVRRRTEIIPGDITRDDLALDAATRARLADEVDTVYHLAAIYDLATPLAISRLVNVAGTEHVLDLCQSLPKLRRLVYFSTAYVSGTRGGVCREDELEQAHAWKNFYEQTKWEAEVAVRRRWDKIPAVIIRPGVVVGDSRTGEINKYDGPYFVIRALDELQRKGRLGWARWLWSRGGTSRLYMVPVDFICDVTEYLAARPDAASHAYHVLQNPSLSMGELTERLFALFGLRPPVMSYPAWLGSASMRLAPPLAAMLQIPPAVYAYMRYEVTYDTANLDRALAGSGITCPQPDDYLPAMVAFVRGHPEIAANFGANATSRPEKVIGRSW
jgi:thioester reductase-like protein